METKKSKQILQQIGIIKIKNVNGKSKSETSTENRNSDSLIQQPHI